MIRYSKCRGCMFYKASTNGEVITVRCACPRGCIRDRKPSGYTNPESRMQDIERRVGGEDA